MFSSAQTGTCWLGRYLADTTTSMNRLKIKKKESITNVQFGKKLEMLQVRFGSVWLSVYMDGTRKCKLSSTPHSTGFYFK
jgi:hypothetical protein